MSYDVFQVTEARVQAVYTGSGLSRNEVVIVLPDGEFTPVIEVMGTGFAVKVFKKGTRKPHIDIKYNAYKNTYHMDNLNVGYRLDVLNSIVDMYNVAQRSRDDTEKIALSALITAKRFNTPTVSF